MTQYNFGFIGEFWILILLIIATTLFSYFIYKKTNPDLSRFFKFTLIGIRSVALALILLILFEPIITTLQNQTKKPKIAIIYDNTESMSVNTKRFDKIAIYKKVIENLDLGEIDKDEFLLDDELLKISDFEFDSLKFKGKNTNFNLPLKYVNDNLDYENYSSVLILTDGVHNNGVNPMVKARELARPIFTIGIGDTNQYKDIKLVNLITNKIGYLDNLIPVIAKFEAFGFKNEEIKITLLENNKIINEKLLTLDPNKNYYEEFFDYIPKSEGKNKLTVKISELKDEEFSNNNSKDEYIDINKSKKKIMIISGSANPDISFVKSEFNKVKNLEITEFIQRNKGEFYKTPNATDFKESELIILIGYPNNFSPDAITKNIKTELDNGKSLIFIPSRDLNYDKAKILKDYLGINVISNSGFESVVEPIVIEKSASNSILKLNEANNTDLWNNLPPLFRTQLFFNTLPTASPIMKFKILGNVFEEPLLLTNEFNKTKSLVFLGYGIYKWKLGAYSNDLKSGDENPGDLFSALFSNSLKWLSIEKNDKRFVLNTSKYIYSLGENIEINAQLYDKLYNPLNSGKILVDIINKKTNKSISSLYLKNIGNGKYYGTINKLQLGEYDVNAKALLENDLVYEKDNTKFQIVTNTNEITNILLNNILLKDLSNATSGKYYNWDNTKELKEDILKNDFHFEKPYSSKNEILVWNYPYLLGLIILLFSVELFLRKRLGLL